MSLSVPVVFGFMYGAALTLIAVTAYCEWSHRREMAEWDRIEAERSRVR